MTERPGIYRIHCTATGRTYIGSASNISKRWSRHRKDLRLDRHANPKLQAAWNKYGESAFVFEIVEFTDELTEREQFWIDAERAAVEGFNLCPVARSSRGRPSKPNPDATKHITDDHRRKGIETRRRLLKLGNKLTPEQVQEIRARYGPHTGPKRKHGLPTCASLAAEFGVSQDTIARLVRGESYRDLGVPFSS